MNLERMLAAVTVFGANCSHCGHRPHPWPCPSTITTGTKRNPQTKPCPCIVGRP